MQSHWGLQPQDMKWGKVGNPVQAMVVLDLLNLKI